MRHIFNENIATHFAAFVQQKHKDGAEEERGSQAVFLYLPFSQQLSGWEVNSHDFRLLTAEAAGLGGVALTPRSSLLVCS